MNKRIEEKGRWEFAEDRLTTNAKNIFILETHLETILKIRHSGTEIKLLTTTDAFLKRD